MVTVSVVWFVFHNFVVVAGVERLSATVGRSRLRRNRCSETSTGQSMEAGHSAVQQVSRESEKQFRSQ